MCPPSPQDKVKLSTTFCAPFNMTKTSSYCCVDSIRINIMTLLFHFYLVFFFKYIHACLLLGSSLSYSLTTQQLCRGCAYNMVRSRHSYCAKTTPKRFVPPLSAWPKLVLPPPPHLFVEVHFTCPLPYRFLPTPSPV